MAAGTENMWTLVVEVYSALRKHQIRLLHQSLRFQPSPNNQQHHNSLERRVDPCIEVRGRGEGAPGRRARCLQDDRQLQRPACLQAGRGRELHLLQVTIDCPLALTWLSLSCSALLAALGLLAQWSDTSTAG